MMSMLIVMIVMIISILALPFILNGILVILMSAYPPLVLVTFVIFIILMFSYIWMMVIQYIVKKSSMKKQMHIKFIGGLFICIGIIGGFRAYDAYINRFATVNGEVDLYEYEPFVSTRLAKLKDRSTLKLHSPVPRLDGATALYPLYAAITQEVYPKGQYPVHSSTVSCNTTPYAYELLLKKEKDIIFVAEPSENQKAMVQMAGEELELTPIAKESFVFFVNVKNPVNALTIEQIKGIYSGAITNWKEVGGKDEDIRAFQRPEESGSQTALLKLMGDTLLSKPLQEDVQQGMGGIISQTASYQNRNNAIGYSFRFFTNEMVKNKAIKLLEINGVEPVVKNVQNGQYPITSTIYAMKLKSNTDEQSAQLLSWLTTKQGRELVEKSGYVPYEKVG